MRTAIVNFTVWATVVLCGACDGPSESGDGGIDRDGGLVVVPDATFPPDEDASSPPDAGHAPSLAVVMSEATTEADQDCLDMGSEEPESEPNNTIESGQTIVVSERLKRYRVAGSFGSSDPDWFNFTAPEGGSYSVCLDVVSGRDDIPILSCSLLVNGEDRASLTSNGGFDCFAEALLAVGDRVDLMCQNVPPYGSFYSVEVRGGDPALATGCNFANFYFSVTSDGVPVRDLSVDDIVASVDGRDLGVEGGNALTQDSTFLVSLLLDASYSITEAGAEADVRDAAAGFITSMPDVALLTIASFASEEVVPEFLQGTPTSDRPALESAVSSYASYPVASSTAATKLYDATAHAAEQGFGSGDESRNRQRLLVMFTDGQDTASTEYLSAGAVRSRADACGVRVFAVGLGDAVDAESLSQLARDEGDVYLAEDSAELGAVFMDLAASLRSLYRLRVITPAFVPIVSSSSVRVSYAGVTETATLERSPGCL